MQRELQILATVAFEEFCNGVADKPGHGDSVFFGQGGEFGIILFVEGDGEAGFFGHGVLFYVKLGTLMRLSSVWFMMVQMGEGVKLIALATLLAAVSLASPTELFIRMKAFRVFASDCPAWPGLDGPELLRAFGVGVRGSSAAIAAPFKGFERVFGRG